MSLASSYFSVLRDIFCERLEQEYSLPVLALIFLATSTSVQLLCASITLISSLTLILIILTWFPKYVNIFIIKLNILYKSLIFVTKV